MKSTALVLIALCFTFVSSASVGAGECPLPYVPLDDTRCIFLDAYVTYTWQDAIDMCAGHGGSLLNYDDCNTFALVYDFITSQEGTSGKHYWLAITDAAEEGTWLTNDNHPVPMGVPFWGPNEPNSGNTVNCAVMHYSSNYYWYDVFCENKYYPICLRNA